MRITIDASAAVHGRAGIGRYTQELITALLALEAPDKPQITIFYNRSGDAHPLDPLDQLSQRKIATGDKPWRLKTALAHLLRQPQDGLFSTQLFHATDNVLPYLAHTPSVFTLFDLTHHYFPQTQSAPNRWYLRLMLPRFLQAAQRVIAISEATRQAALDLYNLPPKKIVATPLGVHPSFKPADTSSILAMRNKYPLPAKFLLFLGTIEPRKNLARLLDALEGDALIPEDPIPLVITGKPGWGNPEVIRRLDDLARGGRVTRLGFVPDQDLPALYAAAHAFVFPSLYEGFGLPVLEAMACGTPVICSDTSSLPEITGDAALPVPPTDARALREAILRLWTDDQLHGEMRTRGLKRASLFSWERTAQETLDVYRRVIPAG